MEGRRQTHPEQDRVLAQGRSSGECQRLKSDIYLKFKRLAFSFDNQLSSRELIE